MQHIIDTMNKVTRQERSNYHVTLGSLIKILELRDPTKIVAFDKGGSPGKPRSFRGHYSDLALEPVTANRTVSEVLADLKEVVGKTLEGYKGGDFLMDESTPLWCAGYGDTGPAVIEVLESEDKVVLRTKEIEY